MPLRRIATADTTFQRVEIWRSANQAEFRVAGAVHAWWHRERFLTGLAWDNLAAACLLRPAGPPQSILMLGLAGGTTFRTLRHVLPDCRLVAVDLDAEIIELARDHMALDELGIEVHIDDAYAWLKRNREKFDVVIDDVYLAGKADVFRPQAWEQSHLKTLRRALTTDGLLAVNLVTGKGHRAMQSHTRQVLRAAFPIVRSVTTPDSQNETLVAGKSVLAESALAAWTAAFHDSLDRRYWRALRVKKL